MSRLFNALAAWALQFYSRPAAGKVKHSPKRRQATKNTRTNKQMQAETIQTSFFHRNTPFIARNKNNRSNKNIFIKSHKKLACILFDSIRLKQEKIASNKSMPANRSNKKADMHVGF